MFHTEILQIIEILYGSSIFHSPLHDVIWNISCIIVMYPRAKTSAIHYFLAYYSNLVSNTFFSPNWVLVLVLDPHHFAKCLLAIFIIDTNNFIFLSVSIMVLFMPCKNNHSAFSIPCYFSIKDLRNDSSVGVELLILARSLIMLLANHKCKCHLCCKLYLILTPKDWPGGQDLGLKSLLPPKVSCLKMVPIRPPLVNSGIGPPRLVEMHVT